MTIKTSIDQGHETWLAEWRDTRDTLNASGFEADSLEGQKGEERLTSLERLLNETPATSLPSLRAQFGYFLEQQGDAVRSNWSDDYANILDTLAAGIETLAARAELRPTEGR